MDDDKLKVLKTEVTSILTSSGTPLTVRQFIKEYREVVGRSFPWAQYGFKNPDECLKSMPDVLSFKKNEFGEVLVPAQSNSSHISKLVQAQKKNSKKGSIRRPRPIQLPRDDFKNEIKPLKQIEIPQHLAFRGWETPQPMPSLMDVPTYQHQQNFAYSSHEYSHMSQNLWNIDQMPLVLNTFSTLKTQYTSTQLPITSKKVPMEEIQELQKLAITTGYCEDERQNSAEDKTNEICANSEDKAGELLENNYSIESSRLGEAHHSKDEDLPKNSYQNFEEDGCPIGEKMKENFRKILKKHKSGLLVSKLASTYSKMFNVGLNCQDYGFPTIKDLVMSCHDVFKIQEKKHAKDWLLFDVNNEPDDSTRWIPTQVLENMQELALAHPNGILSDHVLKLYKKMFKADLDIKKLGFESITSFLVNCQSIECSTNDDKCIVFPMKWGKKAVAEFEESTTDPFLPVDNYSVYKKDFQEDVCGYDFQYEKCVIPERRIIKVIVADCNTPDCLWLQTLDNAALLNSFMYELNTFYDEEEKNYKLDEDMIHCGLACCVKFDNKQWHRGIIQKVLPESQSVKVMYVDYGTTSCISFKDLRTLHIRFATEPIFSFKSKMYNIKPINNKGWTEECLEFLYESIFNVIFVAEIVDTIAEVASVMLVDTKGPEDHVINFMLVENGYAAYMNERSLSQNDHCFAGGRKPNNVPGKEFRPIKKFEENYPDYFLKLLPYWLVGIPSWNNVDHILEQASDELLNESGDDDLSDILYYLSVTRCSPDDLLQLFLKKPKIVCDAWDQTFYSLLNEFEKKFLENIENELVNRLHENKNDNSTGHVDIPNFDAVKEYFEKLKRRKSSTSSITVSPRPANKSETYHSVDQCHSPNQSFCDKDIYNSKNNGNNSLRDTHSSSDVKEIRDLKIIPAKMFNTVIHLIRYNSEVYIIMNELLSKFAKGVPSVLVKHRLHQHQVNVAPFIVTPDHKHLYAELKRQKIDLENGAVSLVPLALSSDILLAVEPRNKTVANVFSEMASECYSSHEFWSC